MKKVLIFGGVLVALAVGAYFGRPFYHEWKQERSLAQARAFMAQSDYRNAALCARQALNTNPSSVEAARIMARVTEMFHSPLALAWWQKVVNLAPATSNRLDLARCALLTGSYPRAEQALSAILPAEQNSAAYHRETHSTLQKRPPNPPRYTTSPTGIFFTRCAFTKADTSPSGCPSTTR